MLSCSKLVCEEQRATVSSSLILAGDSQRFLLRVLIRTGHEETLQLLVNGETCHVPAGTREGEVIVGMFPYKQEYTETWCHSGGV